MTNLKSTIEQLPFLADLEQVIQYIQEKNPALTKSKQLPPKICFEMNQEVHFQKEDVKSTHRHYNYPLLYFLHHLLVEGQLFEIEQIKSKFYYKAHPQNLAMFLDMNPIERYFFVWQTFIVGCDFVVLQQEEDMRNSQYKFYRFLGKIQHLEVGKKYNTRGNLSFIDFSFNYVNLYLIYLGFWELSFDKKNMWRYYFSTFTLTPLGQAVAKILFQKRLPLFWNKQERNFVEEGLDILMMLFEESQIKHLENVEELKKEVLEEKFIAAFQPLFPKGMLEKSIEPLPIVIRKGKYIFKVTLKDRYEKSAKKSTWRKIAIHSSQSLEHLHLAIQDSVDFEDDHLYAFYMDNRRYSDRCYLDSRGEEPPFADEKSLEDLNLSIGQKFLYIFDFGDNWEFEIELLEIDTKTQKKFKAKLIAEQGESPEQYPDWEEY